MKIILDIVDFGEIIVSNSPDNTGLIRLAINDDVGDRQAHTDLNPTELNELICALSSMQKRLSLFNG